MSLLPLLPLLSSPLFVDAVIAVVVGGVLWMDRN